MDQARRGISQGLNQLPEWVDALAGLIGQQVITMSSLSGGCVAEVLKLGFEDGDSAVVKRSTGGGLAIEGWMLRHLATQTSLPVPSVRHCDDTLLVMDYIPSDGGLTTVAESHAADLLAKLHEIQADNFGLETDTVIGGLDQPNPPTVEWVPFFRDFRLMHMARLAFDEGVLPATMLKRIETLAGRLDDWVSEPAAPSLIHGDMWGGNILVNRGKIAAFIDPALYFADREIELAFSTLFSTFGPSFFDRYGEYHTLSENFFGERRYFYNLYPLLVHLRLFGRSYLGQINEILGKFGFLGGQSPACYWQVD